MAEDFSGKATDLVKKILTVGVGAVFLTEEALKTVTAELKLPKEFLAGLLESANKTRKEFLQNLSTDVINKITEQVDVKALVEDVMNRYTVDFKINLSFKKKED